MMKFKNIFLGLCIAAASLNTFAQQSDEHKDHHPEKTAPSAVTIKQTERWSHLFEQLKAYL